MRFLSLLLILFLLFGHVHAGVKESLGIENIDNWSGDLADKLYEDIGDEWDDAGDKISASIFKSITDRELVDFDIAGGNLSFKIKRRAYDNFSIGNSWTVVDTFQVPLSIPIYTSSSIPLGGIDVGVRLTTNIGVEAINIRQVDANSLQVIANLDELNDQIEEDLESLPEYLIPTDDKSSAEDFREGEDYIHIVDEESDKEDRIIDAFKFWETKNPQVIARYSRVLNLLTHPMRLPLTKKALKKMPVSEISSYSLDGAVSLGGHAGWGVKDVSVGAGITTYLMGSFKISVFKESDRFAQVKLTRRKTRGNGVNIGSNHPDFVAFKGFVVFDKTILDLKDSVIPFNMSVDRPTSKTFDIGYRFDLHNEAALDAYSKAVFGRFSDAENLAADGKGVEKVFTKNENSSSSNFKYRMKLAFFFEKESGTSKKFVTANIELPDGQHKIFKAISSNATGYDTLWNMSESRSYTFKTEVDEDLYDTTNDEGLALTVEAKIKDSHTSGKELNRYIEEVEEVTGQYNTFPRVPETVPEVEHGKFGMPPFYGQGNQGQLRRPTNSDKYYKKSSFYYKVGFSRLQVEKFRDVSSDEKWSILEKAFDVKDGAWGSRIRRAWFQAKYSLVTLINLPLSIVNLHVKEGSKLIMARKFYKNWEKLSETNNSQDLVRVTAKLFASANFSLEFIRVVKIVVEGEEISYFLNASNHSTFGNVIKRGTDFAIVDRVTDAANITIDFDHTGPRPVDPHAKIDLTNLKISPVSVDEVEIEFELSSVPEYIFVRLDRTDSWQSFKGLNKMIVANRGENRELFRVGINKWTVRRGDTEGLLGQLSHGIFEVSEKSYKTLQLSVSANQKDWGVLSAHRFRLPRR